MLFGVDLLVCVSLCVYVCLMFACLCASAAYVHMNGSVVCSFIQLAP